jgi:hypothetical protein
MLDKNPTDIPSDMDFIKSKPENAYAIMNKKKADTNRISAL